MKVGAKNIVYIVIDIIWFLLHSAPHDLKYALQPP